MTNDELVTYNGKQYKFSELPPEVQDLLRDDNNNGIPDRFEPKMDGKAAEQIQQTGQTSSEQLLTTKASQNIEKVQTSLIKKYLTTSTILLILSMAAGLVLFILVFFAGVLAS